ncbi:hypothetical protein [Streptomyces sp.]|uniref:hypothetical protein n=1 Tax=Streptomyces sp. TaxID=1931 RepID=UPI002F41704C
MTVALWLMDVFPGASVLRYAVAQLAGSLARAFLGGLTRMLGIYLLAPIAGTVRGAGLHHLLFLRFRNREPLTYRLDGESSARRPRPAERTPLRSPALRRTLLRPPAHTAAAPSVPAATARAPRGRIMASFPPL